MPITDPVANYAGSAFGRAEFDDVNLLQSNVTISGGTTSPGLTGSHSWLNITTGGVNTLDTITDTYFKSGDMIVLTASGSSAAISMGTAGNIKATGFVLTNDNALLLIFNGTDFIGTGMSGDFLINVAKGLVAGHSIVQKFGRNPDTDTSSDPEDVWDAGGVWVAPTTARVHNLASTSGSDAAAGSGAITVDVEGLDASGDVQTETVNMNGVSNVATANSYTIIYRMKVATAGSTGSNVGTITATAVTDATVTAQINAANGQSLMAIYEIPNAKTGYLLSWYASMNKAGAAGTAQIRIVAEVGGVTQVKSHVGLQSTGSSFAQEKFDAIPSFAAGTILKIEINEVSGNDTDVSAGFDLLLVDD